jgi:hypothetical protein
VFLKFLPVIAVGSTFKIGGSNVFEAKKNYQRRRFFLCYWTRNLKLKCLLTLPRLLNFCPIPQATVLSEENEENEEKSKKNDKNQDKKPTDKWLSKYSSKTAIRQFWRYF